MGDLLFDGPAQQLEASIEKAAERARGEAELQLDRVVVGTVDVSKREGKPVFFGEGLEDRADLFAGLGGAGNFGVGGRDAVEHLLAGARRRRSPDGARAA